MAETNFPPIRERKRTGPFDCSDCVLEPPAGLFRGIEEFNQGYFYAQHETLELLWRAEPGDIRYLYQGILLVGVGCYHLKQGNRYGAIKKLSSGINLLSWFRPVCQQVDVARLVEDAERLLEHVQTLGADRLARFDPRLLPKVHLATSVK